MINENDIKNMVILQKTEEVCKSKDEGINYACFNAIGFRHIFTIVEIF